MEKHFRFFAPGADEVRDDTMLIDLRDYIEHLASPFERETCERFLLKGESLESIAASWNLTVRDLLIDLRAALTPFRPK